MASAYTPGLNVLARTTLRRLRRLPLAGDVLVKPGDCVTAEQIVMRTNLPGPADMVNVVSLLGIMPNEVARYMKKAVGDQVKKGEIFAEKKGFLGMFTTSASAPMDGSIEAVSSVTGQVTVRGPVVPVEIAAYIDGTVVAVEPGESVTVEATGAFIQGIFGIGGETSGIVAMAVQSPNDVLTPAHITAAHAGKIVVGGSFASYDTLRKAIDVGARAVIAGGFDDADMRKLLGYDLGVAITGQETLGVTLVVTEGFGEIRMADKTFNLLKSCEGKRASVNGATQIRAGVMRPEIIVPTDTAGHSTDHTAANVLAVGTVIRAISDPYFGKIGVVVALPVELTALATEAHVRVLACRFEDQTEAILPRANVEVIATQ